MIEKIQIAYGIYGLIGIVVSTIIGGRPFSKEEPWDDSLSRRLSIAIWWPFALMIIFSEWRKKGGGNEG